MDNHHTRNRENYSSDDEVGGDENQISSASTSIIHLPPDGETYEVFLNFRGEETRKEFTDHLYHRLVNAGVRVFRDDEALHVGEEIGPELDQAIKASMISIPIISPDYASSEWCLRELAHILKCKKTAGQVVLPVFYRVKPSDVRHQTGTFKKAFHLHKKNHGSKSKVVQEWRDALTEVASLKGWESSKFANGHEGRLTEDVVTSVSNVLNKNTLILPENLVGIESHKENILKMVEGKEYSNAQAIIIHGMGGVGKTTLAKIVYNHLSTKFKYHSFLPNIRERLSQQNCLPEDLQKQFIKNILGTDWQGEISHVDKGINVIKERVKQKKILVLFDDVDHTDQLDALARQRSWFKSGSILIITTRNKDILKTWEERLLYELNELDFPLSFQLFCKHAFGRDDPPTKKFHTITKNIVGTTGGLPLAIEIIGSMLLGESKDYWKGVYKRLQKVPHEDVQKKLRISYDALNNEQKQIFLDIACLSIQGKTNFAFYMWDDCEFFPKEGIRKLISLSLLKMGEEKELIIHDQLRDLGRAIVHEEADLRNRSRLWIKEEADEVIKRMQGTQKIQTLNLSFDGKPEEGCFFTSEQFKDMTNLRFLQLKNAKLKGDFKNLLLDLRWLQWEKCSSDSLPTNFHPTKLVVLDLSYSSITERWEGWAQFELAKELKVLKLECCYGLTTSPDFSAFEKLEILNLEDCINLRSICPSICNLKKSLKILNVRGCTELEKLPTEIGEMEKLRHLLVDKTSVREIPISKGFMTKLEIISAMYCTKLRHLSDSIGSLENLVILSLYSCPLTMLPKSVGKLKSLTKLYLQHSNVKELPNSIGDLHHLRELDISDTSIKRLPSTIGMLRNLQYFTANDLQKLTEVPDEIGELSSLQSLDLSGCRKLKSMRKLPCSLTSLNFSGESMEVLPNMPSLSKLKVLTYHDNFERWNKALNVGSLNSLESLTIDGYYRPQSVIISSELILELPSSLKKLRLSKCPTLRALLNLSDCKLLSSLDIMDCQKLSKLSNMGDSVMYCRLGSCYALERLPHLSSAKNLRRLFVVNCTNLIEIQGLDSVVCLDSLIVDFCPSLKRLGDLSCLKMLRELNLFHCEKLSDFDGIDEQTFLKSLRVVGCNPKIRSLDLSKLKYLEVLELNQFKKLTEIMMLQKLEYLLYFQISCCNSLEKLPDFSLFTSLREVHVDGCKKLTEIRGLDMKQKNLTSVRISCSNSSNELLDISPCTSLEVVLMNGHEKLTEIKGLQGQKNLIILDLSSCKSLKTLPDLSLSTNLTVLIVKGCERLTEIKGLPMPLRVLDIIGCKSLVNVPDLSHCCYLKGLVAKGCDKLTRIMGLQGQRNLEILDFSSCKSLRNFPDFSVFTKLVHLNLNGCKKLSEIKGLPMSLKTLDISGCNALVSLPNFLQCPSLEVLLAEGCSQLTDIRGLPELCCLTILHLASCKSLEYLPDISLLEKLVHLNLNGCEKLTEIEGLPMSLKILDISGCNLLANLPDFSQCSSLKELRAKGCSKLTNITGLPWLCSLELLDLSSCKSLENLPNFSLLAKHLNLNGCEKLTAINGLLMSSKTLDISGCSLLANLPYFFQSDFEYLEPQFSEFITQRGQIEHKVQGEIDSDGMLKYKVFIIGSYFHHYCDDQRSTLWCGEISINSKLCTPSLSLEAQVMAYKPMTTLATSSG